MRSMVEGLSIPQKSPSTTVGPAISFRTSCCDLPQKEQ